MPCPFCFFFFFFNDTATTEIYTLSLHDALPIWLGMYIQGEIGSRPYYGYASPSGTAWTEVDGTDANKWKLDRKSTRLNSSHLVISYAVFCLKKKKDKRTDMLNRMLPPSGYHLCC